MNYRLRSDLEFFPLEKASQAEGAIYQPLRWVVRDPLSRHCFYLEEEEYFLLKSLEKRDVFFEITKQFERKFSPRQLAPHEFQQLISDWVLKGLLICDPLQHSRLKTATGQQIGGNVRALFWQRLANPLVIRFRGWDPQRFLESLSSVTGWLFSRFFFLFSFFLFLLAGSIAFSRFGQIIAEAAMVPALFQAEHWLVIFLLLGLTKVLHEFGHALTCHRFGGRCHEMGVMFLAFVPCLYCNVTDAWTFKHKRHRVAVSAAGIFVDLWIAAFCLILWSVTQPGFLHSSCLLLAIFGSINSVLLNGNPLMRYDGYYIASDLLGIVNLRAESLRQAKRIFWRMLFGKKTSADENKFSPAMAAYGIASGVYLWLVIVLILISLHFALKPFQLEVVAMILGIVIVPAQLYSTIKKIHRESQSESRLRNDNGKKVVIAGVILFGLLWVILFVPFPRRVPATGVLRPVSQQRIIATNSGVVVTTNTSDEKITEGKSILLLQNKELDFEISSLQNKLELLDTKAVAIRKKRTLFAQSAENLAVLEEILTSTRNQIAQLQKKKKSLNLISEANGDFVPDPSFQQKVRSSFDHQEGSWGQVFSGFDLLAKGNHGQFISRGTPVGIIAEPNSYQVLLAVEDHWVKRIEIGADVLVFSPESPGVPLRGTLQEISYAIEVAAPAHQELTEEQQLRTYVKNQPGGGTQKHLFAIVEIDDNRSIDLSYYQLCSVRIRAKNASLWSRAVDYLSRTLVRF